MEGVENVVDVKDLVTEEQELQARLEQIKVEKVAAEELAKQKAEQDKAAGVEKKKATKKTTKKVKPKKKMKTNKKFFIWLTLWAMLMQTYVLVMIIHLKDPMTLSIVAGVVFGEVVLFFLGFLKYTLNIDLKHMDKNYNPNYDEENNLY